MKTIICTTPIDHLKGLKRNLEKRGKLRHIKRTLIEAKTLIDLNYFLSKILIIHLLNSKLIHDNKNLQLLKNNYIYTIIYIFIHKLTKI